jgi:hypothetical protein
MEISREIEFLFRNFMIWAHFQEDSSSVTWGCAVLGFLIIMIIILKSVLMEVDMM